MDGGGAAWVVVPAYDEAPVIGRVVSELRRHFRQVVVVDDGSSDATGDLAREAGAFVLRHPVNLGQGAALQTGMTFALRRGARWVITFDADGQHRAEDAKAMLARIQESSADVVLGSRFLGQTVGMPWTRRLLIKAACVFTRLTTGLRLTDAHNGLRVFSRKAASELSIRQNRMAHASEIIEQIAKKRMRFEEHANTVMYTDYSMAKGQRSTNAVSVLIELFVRTLSK